MAFFHSSVIACEGSEGFRPVFIFPLFILFDFCGKND